MAKIDDNILIMLKACKKVPVIMDEFNEAVIKKANRSGLIHAKLIHSVGYVCITTRGEEHLKNAKI